MYDLTWCNIIEQENSQAANEFDVPFLHSCQSRCVLQGAVANLLTGGTKNRRASRLWRFVETSKTLQQQQQ